ncbi:penicillin-binding transpeptidase domain-containing protein [Paucilactobacillus nenjiangensis]|uniref:penicillin-binding transpeptidase domain-containing protein n=1 Tax=Paucilactobacillus nenjiangensis TaxID=1296540 RepID=UPI003F9D4475
MNKKAKRTMGHKTAKNRKIFGQWLFFFVGALFLLLIVRFGYIGIMKKAHGVSLNNRIDILYTQKSVIQAKRGTIYDSQNNKIADNTSTYKIYAVLDKKQKTTSGKPLYVTNKTKTAKVLSKYLGLSEKEVTKILSPSSKTYQVEFGNAGAGISIETKRNIENKKLTGINFVESPAREYANGSFASQLIGIAQPTTNAKTGQTKLIGQLGLESIFNKELTGTNGVKKSKEDTSGYQIDGTKKSAKNGDDIYTTLNNKLQTLLEGKMDATASTSKATSLNAVLMNAKTGAIVAATQRPSYNTDDKTMWRNTLIEDAYEPGSTMKVFTMSAAIDSGNFNPNAYYQSGTYSLGGGQITDWNSSGWGSITYREGFERSSNVAMAHLEQTMGAKTWKKYLNRFGFMKKVNVLGMTNEAKGSAPFSGALEQANTAYGQGITVNAMQMLQGFSAVANKGKMLKPYFVKKIVDSNTNKVVQKSTKKVVGTPIKSSTAKSVLKYMQDVIYGDKGTGSVYQIDGYRVAGKTGTAQIGTASGYETGSTAYVYSLVGMAPAKNPKYIMYITLTKPKNTSSSAETFIASVFNPVMKQALDTDKAKREKSTQGRVKVPSVKGQNVATAQAKISSLGLQYVVIGNGNKVQAQSVSSSLVLNNSRIFLMTGGDTTTVPDMNGWSKKDVVSFAKLANLKIETSGSGYLTSQSIQANTAVNTGQTLTVKFEKK